MSKTVEQMRADGFIILKPEFNAGQELLQIQLPLVAALGIMENERTTTGDLLRASSARRK